MTEKVQNWFWWQLVTMVTGNPPFPKLQKAVFRSYGSTQEKSVRMHPTLESKWWRPGVLIKDVLESI